MSDYDWTTAMRVRLETERDALRTQLEAVTRERDEAADEAAACVEFLRNLSEWHAFWEEGFLGEKTASASRQNGQALRAFLDETGHARRVVERIAALERERDEARAFAADREGLALQLDAARETIQYGIGLRKKAEAEVARLREALRCVERACIDQQLAAKEYKLDVGLPYLQFALDIARAALASAPSAEPTRADAERWLKAGPEEPGGTLAFHAESSAEPTPRDMRVAEAVQNAERLRCLRVGSAFINMMSPREPFGCADMSRFACAERDTPTSDLAAVVAKAVKP